MDSVEFIKTKETLVHNHGKGIILISRAGFMEDPHANYRAKV